MAVAAPVKDQMPPLLSGRRPVAGHTVEFLRNPVGLLERGLAERGRVFSLRLGNRDAVVLLGPEHHDFFFSETDKLLSIRTAYPFFVEMFGDRFWYFAGNDEWRRQRALVVPRFQGRQLEGYVAVMAAETEALTDRLGAEGSFDLVPTLGPLVMRIAGRAFLGEEFSARLGEGFFTEFRKFSGGMEPVLPLWLPLPRLIRSKQARAGLHRTLGALIAERRRHPLDPPDFLQTLSGSRYADGAEVPDEVLVNLILLLTWAGHETTAGHISWALADLLAHPDYLDQVLTEQDAAVGGAGTGGVPGTEQLAQLRHMDWALHETERLHPVAYMLMRSAAQAFAYQGHTVPEKAMVLISPAVAHRLPDVYPQPHRYLPERHDNAAAPAGGGAGMAKLIGFGGGIHRCLGVHFAYLEMKVILTLLLRRYQLQLLDPNPKPIPGAKTKWPASPCRVAYRLRACM